MSDKPKTIRIVSPRAKTMVGTKADIEDKAEGSQERGRDDGAPPSTQAERAETNSRPRTKKSGGIKLVTGLAVVLMVVGGIAWFWFSHGATKIQTPEETGLPFYTATVNGVTWAFAVNEGAAEILASPTGKYGGAVQVPSQFGRYRVARIGEDAFQLRHLHWRMSSVVFAHPQIHLVLF